MAKKAVVKKSKKSKVKKTLNKSVKKKPAMKATSSKSKKTAVKKTASKKTKTVAKTVFKSLAGTSKPSKKIASQLVTTFLPLGDRVLITQGTGESKTQGGIYIPVAFQEKPLQGRVIQIGQGFKNKKGQTRPLDVQIGDEVMFKMHAGTSVQLDGKDYLLLSEKEIIGVVAKT